MTFDPPKHERTRHVRKYIEGNLGKNRSFYFRGPDARLNLKAHNLLTFVQIAEGIDEATWEFHRTRGDYSRWFRDEVKDAQLADEAAAIEGDAALTATASRDAIKSAVDKRYTLPADKPSGVVDEVEA